MKTKAKIPISALEGHETLPVIQVYYEFVHLKQLYRQGWLMRGIQPEKCESVAEHSFGVAVLALLLADAYFPALDRAKLLKMALIHDFGEIYAGDIVPGTEIGSAEKHALEKKAATQVFEKLPNGAAYLEVWAEYEDHQTPEAQFIHQIDKLEMALQASVYEQQHEIDLSDFYQSAEKEISVPELTAIITQLRANR